MIMIVIATPPQGAPPRPPLFTRLWNVFVWWLIFSGIYASSAICPFCGRIGCPVGGASAGLVGGFFAVLLPAWKRLLGYFKSPILMSRFSFGPQKLDNSSDQ
jgi:hypothetical protein